MRTISNIAVVVLMITLGSCNGEDIKSICEERSTRFQQRVDLARSELGPMDRAIASIGSVDSRRASIELVSDDRERWMEWSLDRLLDIQDYLDRLDEYPQFKAEARTLMLASNELVMMYSLAQRGDSFGMQESLQRVESLAMPALKKTCNDLP